MMFKKYFSRYLMVACIVVSMVLLAGCEPDVPTQDVLPTATPTVTPAIGEFTYETIVESVLPLGATDSTAHEAVDLGILRADYFAMPTYRRIDNIYSITYGRYNQNILASFIPDNHSFYGVYGLTDEGMVWSEPRQYYGEFTMYDTKFRYLVGYAELGGRLYNAMIMDKSVYDASPYYWRYANDGSGPEVMLSGKYYPVILNTSTGEIRDFLREINPAVVDQCVANKNFTIITRSGDRMLFYTGNDIYYLDMAAEKVVELTDMPTKAPLALRQNNSYVVGVYGDVMLVVTDKKYGSPDDDKGYFLCDAGEGKVTVLEDVVGEELNGCSVFDGEIICAGENYYWSVDIDTLEVVRLLETGDVVIGYTEPQKTDYNQNELFNNASFVIIGSQGNYQVYDFAKGTISNLDQLGRWEELDASSYVVSPDGRKMAIYSEAQDGCIQFAILDCDTNSFVDVVREGESGMTEETRIWWYKDSAIAVAPDDRQTVNVYTIK